MNIATLLRNALVNGDWSEVSEAYFMLSGERIDPPENDTAAALSIIMKNLMELLLINQ